MHYHALLLRIACLFICAGQEWFSGRKCQYHQKHKKTCKKKNTKKKKPDIAGEKTWMSPLFKFCCLIFEQWISKCKFQNKWWWFVSQEQCLLINTPAFLKDCGILARMQLSQYYIKYIDFYLSISFANIKYFCFIAHVDFFSFLLWGWVGVLIENYCLH